MKKLSAAQKISMIEEWRHGKLVRLDEIKRSKVTNTKTVLDSNIGKDFGFRDNNSSMIYNDDI
jgi:hypothetical protein